MDIGVLLSAVNFVHLKSREGGPFRSRHVKGLTRRESGNPVTVAHIVVGAGLEFPSWGEESAGRLPVDDRARRGVERTIDVTALWLYCAFFMRET